MSEVLYTVEGGVGSITINRPDQRNALNPAVLDRLREAIQSANTDPMVRVVTLTGAGNKIFCAGADLKVSLKEKPGGDAFGRSDFRKLLYEITTSAKPTLALVRGHVFGGGMGLVLACDLALACDDVQFATPEIKVGMFPMIVMAFLYRRVGRKRTTEMMFLGESVPASRAAEDGIVNHVFPREQFETASAEFIGKLLDKSSGILGMGKEAITHILDRTLPTDLEYLESALARVMACADSREGIRAFVEKRKPQWRHS